MTIQEKLSEADKIINEVKQMRILQLQYFKYKDDSTLAKLRAQSDKVNRMVDNYLPKTGGLY